MEPACAVDGCTNAPLYRDLCRNHYVRERPGDSNTPNRRQQCRLDDCDRVIEDRATGLCRVHLARLRRTGSTELRERPTVCVVDDCERPPRKRSMCTMHYERAKRYGDPLHLEIGGTFEQRLSRLVEPTGFCWYWIGRIDRDGYGRTAARAGNGYAYRWVYEELVGPIPDGLQLDHLCRIKSCVNPDHLEPVTGGENVRRALRAKGVLTSASDSEGEPSRVASRVGEPA